LISAHPLFFEINKIKRIKHKNRNQKSWRSKLKIPHTNYYIRHNSSSQYGSDWLLAVSTACCWLMLIDTTWCYLIHWYYSVDTLLLLCLLYTLCYWSMTMYLCNSLLRPLYTIGRWPVFLYVYIYAVHTVLLIILSDLCYYYSCIVYTTDKVVTKYQQSSIKEPDNIKQQHAVETARSQSLPYWEDELWRI